MLYLFALEDMTGEFSFHNPGEYERAKSQFKEKITVQNNGIVNLRNKKLDGEKLLIVLYSIGNEKLDVRGFDLAENEIGPFGAKELGRFIKDKKITTLNLEGNKIGDQGIINLSSNISNIEYLNLRNNGITAEGLRSFIVYFVKSQSLQYLDLRGNPLKDEGIKILAGALSSFRSHNISFELLLGSNEMTKDSIKILVEALKKSDIQKLTIEEWQDISENDREEFRAIEKLRPGFKVLFSKKIN